MVVAWPRRARTALTGAGLGSQKLACMRRKNWRLILRAVLQSPLTAARTISAMGVGITFEATEIRPAAPRARVGRARHVVPGEDAEVARELGQEFGDLDEVATGFLDADDVGDLGEAE